MSVSYYCDKCGTGWTDCDDVYVACANEKCKDFKGYVKEKRSKKKTAKKAAEVKNGCKPCNARN